MDLYLSRHVHTHVHMVGLTKVQHLKDGEEEQEAGAATVDGQIEVDDTVIYVTLQWMNLSRSQCCWSNKLVRIWSEALQSAGRDHQRH